MLLQLLERAGRPGVMSLNGSIMEKKAAQVLRGYFEKIGSKLDDFSRFAAFGAQEGRHASELSATHLTRRNSQLFIDALAPVYAEAMLRADKQPHMARHFKEADDGYDIDEIGLSAQEAAQYAATAAGKAVVGVNKTTVASIADAVEEAILNQAGVAGLSRSLRELGDSFTKVRADMIARTEMADAFGEAAIQKLIREEIEYKQLITSPDACEICSSIEDAGPVPVSEPFVDEDGEEYDRSPIHVNCRCATVGARAPEGDDDEA